MVRAARTLVGKPITINHDLRRIVGHVIDAEEENNAIEYVGEINKREYVQKLLDAKKLSGESYYQKWLKNPITSLSVEADYRHNCCIECGQSFYDQETFEKHMWESHKVKNFKFEPRGILMKALSLVEPPEKPGVLGTTIELMEKAGNMSRLIEILSTDLKNEMEWRKEMKKVAAVTPEKRIAAIPPKIKEQEDEEPKEACPEGQHRDPETGKCVPDEPKEAKEQTQQELPEPTVAPAVTCPEGFKDDGHGHCTPIEWTELGPTAKVPAPQITPEPTIEVPKVDVPTPAPAPIVGPVLEQEGTQLPPAPFPTAPPEAPTAITKECPEGSHYDKLAGTCVPDLIQEQPPGLEGRVDAGAPIVSEITLPPMLKLGEPFADYTSFDDCVSKNRGKVDDPEAYCATIKRKVEGETVSETVTKTFPYLEEISTNAWIRDIKIAEAINIQNKALGKLTQGISSLIKRDDTQTIKLTQTLSDLAKKTNAQTLSESKIRSHYDKASLNWTAKALRKIIETNNANVTWTANTLKKIMESNNTNVTLTTKALVALTEANQATSNSLLKAIEYTNKKLGQLATANANVTAKLGRQKKDYETILNAVDTKFVEYKKTMETRLKEQEDELKKRECEEGFHYDKEEGKCVPNKEAEELAKVKEKLSKLTEDKDKKIKETASVEERLKTVEDNIRATVRGEFKGHKKPAEKGEPDYGDPGKLMRETAKKKK